VATGENEGATIRPSLSRDLILLPIVITVLLAALPFVLWSSYRLANFRASLRGFPTLQQEFIKTLKNRFLYTATDDDMYNFGSNHCASDPVLGVHPGRNLKVHPTGVDNHDRRMHEQYQNTSETRRRAAIAFRK
jgi:hypothetical protein